MAELLSPLLPALVFVLVMSGLPEPMRRELNAVIAGGLREPLRKRGLRALGVRLHGDRHRPRLPGPALLPLDRRSPGSCTPAGTSPHHLYGNPLWHFSPSSSYGCAVMDAAVAVWFFPGRTVGLRLAAPQRAPRLTSAGPERTHDRDQVRGLPPRRLQLVLGRQVQRERARDRVRLDAGEPPAAGRACGPARSGRRTRAAHHSRDRPRSAGARRR